MFIHTFGVFAFAANNTLSDSGIVETPLLQNISDDYIENVLALAGYAGFNYSIVTYDNAVSQTNGYGRSTSDVSFAIRVNHTDDSGNQSIVMILPFVVTNTDLDNSINAIGQYPFNNTVVVTVTANVDQINAKGSLVYRTYGAGLSWNSSNSTATVYELCMEFVTYGDLFRYPDVLTYGVTNDTLIQIEWQHTLYVNTYDTRSSVYYSNTQNPMANSQVVCLEQFFHGIAANLSICYSLDGVQYYQEKTIPFYTK